MRPPRSPRLAGCLVRALRLLAVLACAGATAGRADDALVLPAGVFRVYAVGSSALLLRSWDADGGSAEIPKGSGRLRAVNLGLAVEYGVNRWLTAGVQWTPGLNVSSSFDVPPGDPAGRDRATLDDAFDALAGFKAGLVGSPARNPARSTGLVHSDAFRLAIGAGVKLPVARIRWDEQALRFREGRTFLAQAVDRHLVAPVFGIHGDWVAHRDARSELYVNLYSQYVDYLTRIRYGETSLARWVDPSVSGLRLDYRYDLLVEAEPRYERWVAPGVLRAGIHAPVRWRYFPETKLEGARQANAGYRATFTPSLDLLTTAAGIPLELKVGFQTTFAGRRTLGGGSWIVIVRAMP